ncbi:MAG: hypothetical protein DRP66_08065 [Planctomycetota bacterium]|nr:MAG: hypothetical protein DRP66_08065 [Planctomycetota bacterium]
MGDGVVGRIVHIVRPLVNVVGPGLDRSRPAALLFDAGDAIRGKYAENLIFWNIQRRFYHEQIDEVVVVGQGLSAELFNRYRSIQTERFDMLSCLLDIVCVCIQAVNHVAVVYMQGGGELSVAAADVDNQAALNTAGIKYGFRLLRRVCCRRNGGKQAGRQNNEECADCTELTFHHGCLPFQLLRVE